MVPDEGLYVKSPSDSNPILPPSTSPPAVKIIALFSSVFSLSVIVTVVATAAVPAVAAFKLATCVVEATVNGAVPVATSD